MTISEQQSSPKVEGLVVADQLVQDPRAERTRHSIFSAVSHLTASRTSKISVGDVVRVAGISRSTFYAHFSSLDELAAELLREQFSAIGTAGLALRREDLIPARNAARIGFSRLIEHLVDHYPLYSGVLDLPGARSAYDEVLSDYATRVLESVVRADRVPDTMSAKSATTYLAGGAIALISEWMRGTVEATDEEIVEQLVEMLPGWLTEVPA